MSKFDVGDRIKQVRAGSGLNGRDFAARLDTSAGRISEIENGKTMPGGDFLQRLQVEFGVDLNWLMSGATFGVQPLTPEETALVDNFRHSPPEARKAIKTTSDLLAQRHHRDGDAQCG